MLFTTVAEYDAEIASVKEDIRRIRKIGQEHSHEAGGTSRRTNEVDFSQLQDYLVKLQNERSALDSGTTLGQAARFGW